MLAYYIVQVATALCTMFYCTKAISSEANKFEKVVFGLFSVMFAGISYIMLCL